VIASAHRPIRTFHVHLGGAMASRAAEIARSLSFQHEEVRAGDDPASFIGQHLAAQDQPSIDGANTWLIARAIRAAGLKVAVSGLGADELFLGYRLHRSYLRARALAGRFDRLAAPLGRVAGTLARALAQPFLVDKLLGVVAAAGTPAATHAALRALFPPAQAARLLPGIGAASPPEIRAPSVAGEVSRLELSGYVRNTLLRDADVMGMAHGVELRVPMLERTVVETVLALPPSVKLRQGVHKPLLTDAVPELPRELTSAKKRGFDLPWDDWLAGPLRAPVEASLRTRDGRLGLEPRELERVWRRFLLRRDRPSAMRCWALHALVDWAERHRATR
jgi:asparagine synthase (glutamine-hydrolysing)